MICKVSSGHSKLSRKSRRRLSWSLFNPVSNSKSTASHTGHGLQPLAGRSVQKSKEATEKDQLEARSPACPWGGLWEGRGSPGTTQPHPSPFLDGGGIWLLLPPHHGPRFTSPFRPHTDLNHSVDTSWGCLPHLRSGVLVPVDNCSSPLHLRAGPRSGPGPPRHGTSLATATGP